jgi:hypothetical protein
MSVSRYVITTGRDRSRRLAGTNHQYCRVKVLLHCQSTLAAVEVVEQRTESEEHGDECGVLVVEWLADAGILSRSLSA